MIPILVMYALMVYIVACADAVQEPGNMHLVSSRVIRAVAWPVTLTSWFVTQNIRLHRLLNILWAVLIGGWFLSLVADKL